MKLFKWFVFIALGLILAGIAAAAAGVFYIQNNDLSGMVRWAAQKQGYQVEISGPVRVKLFPTLTAKVGKFSMAALSGGGKFVDLDAAAVELKWGIGLTPWKNMQLVAVEAMNPTVYLHKTKEGVANWVPAQKAQEISEPQSAPAACKAGEECNQLAMLVAARLAVANLNLTYDDESTARKVVVKDMDVQVNTNGTAVITKLDGSVNEKPLKGDMEVNVADMDNIPVTAKLNGAGLNLAVNGRVIEQKEFAGLISAQTANFKGTLDDLLGKAPPQAPAESFKLTGDVTLGAERVILRNFSTALGSLFTATGKVDVALGKEPSAQGQIQVSGDNLRNLAELASGQAQASVPALPFTLNTNLSGKDAIVLQNLTFALSSLAQVSGDVSIVPPAATGGQPQIDATLAAKVNNVQSLTQALKVTGTFPQEPLSARLTLKSSKGAYNVPSFEAQLSDILSAKGNIDMTPGDKPRVDGALNITGANVQAAAKAFGMESGSLPATPFKVSAGVSGQGTLNIKNLVVDLPQLLEASGDLEFTPGKPANLNGSLNITRFNGNALGYCQAAAAPASAAPVTTAPAKAADTPWSDEPLNLQALRDYAVNLTVSVKNIACSNFPAKEVSVKVANTPSQLDIKQLAISLPEGGSINADATLEHAGTPKLMLKLNLAKVAVEELAPTLKAKGVALPIDGQASLSSFGSTTRTLAKNLGGSMGISANSGKLPYTNMLGNIGNIERLLSGQASVPSNGNGDVDSLKASYTVKQGVATTDEFGLSTNGGAMKLTGSGTIDIGSWVIDYVLTPTVGSKGNISVPVLVKGPLGGPSIGADPAFVQKLTSRLASEGIQGLLGMDKEDTKGIGAAVGDVISGKGLTGESVGKLLEGFTKPKTTAPAASPTEGTTPTTEQKVDPAKELIKGLLGQ